MFRALLFDVDGTLAETERDGHRPAFNAAFAEAGLAWRWDPALYGELLAVAGGKERIAAFARRADPDFLAAPDAEARIRALHAGKTRHYLAALAGGAIGLRPGVAELLSAARAASTRLAIATTTTPDNVTALLAATLGPEAVGWFEVIGAGDVVAAKKPAPDIYRFVLAGLGTDAADCLAIEDSAVGLQAALAAGVPTVVTRSFYTAGEDFRGALAVLPDLAAVGLEGLARLWRSAHG